MVITLIDNPVADRIAESFADYAEFLKRLGVALAEADHFYDQAGKRLAALPPGFNQPLRLRIAAWRAEEKG